MSIATGLQLVAFNTAVAGLALGLGHTAGPNDRMVHVLYPPWLAASEVRHRIEIAGGIVVAGGTAWLASKVVVREPDTLDRLAAGGALLIIAASPSPICAGPRGALP